MFDFLKRLFNSQKRDLTVVIFDEKIPQSSMTYHFRPSMLWKLFYVCLALVFVITLLLVIFTPVGSLIFNRNDARLREQAIEISQRVRSLQDSLRVREAQLTEIKQVIATGADTTYSVDKTTDIITGRKKKKYSEPDFFSEVSNTDLLSNNEIIFTEVFKRLPQFPSAYPLDGTFTRTYNSENGHYGIDIATKQGTPFKAVSDGAVINQDWSINYGFVLHVQHSDGIITVYKHAASLSKSVGDVVLKGDILGTAGDAGLMSSGPHLHMEIWKNGVPQNPNMYLTKL